MHCPLSQLRQWRCAMRAVSIAETHEAGVSNMLAEQRWTIYSSNMGHNCLYWPLRYNALRNCLSSIYSYLRTSIHDYFYLTLERPASFKVKIRLLLLIQIFLELVSTVACILFGSREKNGLNITVTLKYSPSLKAPFLVLWTTLSSIVKVVLKVVVVHAV